MSQSHERKIYFGIRSCVRANPGQRVVLFQVSGTYVAATLSNLCEESTRRSLTNGRKILQRCWRNWSSIFPSIFIRLVPWTMSAFIFMFRFTDVIMYPSFHYQSPSLSFYTGLTPCFNHIVLSSKSIILFPFGEQPQTLSHQHARFISMWQMFSGGG